MLPLSRLQSYCDRLLRIDEFEDYCPNGLQVEGRGDVRRIVSGVTANQALLDAAIADAADLILVHHGYFWRGEAAPLVGMKGRRVRALMAAEVSLLAYHLPLDAHPEFGNNRQLGLRLGFERAAAVDGRATLLALEQLRSLDRVLPGDVVNEGLRNRIATLAARPDMPAEAGQVAAEIVSLQRDYASANPAPDRAYVDDMLGRLGRRETVLGWYLDDADAYLLTAGRADVRLHRLGSAAVLRSRLRELSGGRRYADGVRARVLELVETR